MRTIRSERAGSQAIRLLSVPGIVRTKKPPAARSFFTPGAAFPAVSVTPVLLPDNIRQVTLAALVWGPSCWGRNRGQSMNNTPRYWYTEKRYLFGQRFPLTWEGWLVDALWCASVLGLSPFLRKEGQHLLWALGLFFGLIAVFMTIRHWKGAP